MGDIAKTHPTKNGPHLSGPSLVQLPGIETGTEITLSCGNVEPTPTSAQSEMTWATNIRSVIEYSLWIALSGVTARAARTCSSLASRLSLPQPPNPAAPPIRTHAACKLGRHAR
jgi:hypothetical protein